MSAVKIDETIEVVAFGGLAGFDYTVGTNKQSEGMLLRWPERVGIYLPVFGLVSTSIDRRDSAQCRGGD